MNCAYAMPYSLPTAAGSFVVAVNALFLSFSPLKIREHSSWAV